LYGDGTTYAKLDKTETATVILDSWGDSSGAMDERGARACAEQLRAAGVSVSHWVLDGDASVPKVCVLCV